MDGSGSSRLESDRPSKSSRQSGPGIFQPLITELEMVIQPPIFFQSPGSVRDKAEGQPYWNVPLVEDDRKQWALERFSYQTLIDRDRASAVRLNGTLDTIAQQLAAYTYRGSQLLNNELFFKVVDALNSVVFGQGGGGGDGEALQALRENTKLFEVAQPDAVISNLQNHNGTVTLPLLLYLHNALSEASNKKPAPGLEQALAAAGVTDKDVYQLWYEIFALIKVFSGYPRFPITQSNDINKYISDLYEIDPRPDADPTDFFMAAQNPDAGFGFDDEEDEDDTEKMQE